MSAHENGVELSPPPHILDSAELRAILAQLGGELAGPLAALRAGLDRLLNDPAPDDQRRQVVELFALCDDLDALARRSLDEGGLAHAPGAG